MLTIPETLTIAQTHHQAGRLQEAEALYRQILQAQPDHPDALHLLGVIAHQVGHHEIAVRHISRAIAGNPHVAEFHNNIGEAYRAQGRLAEAQDHYLQAIALKPAYAEAYNNLGNIRKEQGRPEEAVACYQQALARKPDLPEAHNNLGIVLKEQGRLDDAIGHYRQVLTFKPTYAEAHNNLGTALQEQGELEEAMAHYRQTLALNPQSAEAYNNLGGAFHEQGDMEEAVRHYRRAIELKPAYAEAYSNLGAALHAQGKPEEAVASYRKALTFKPDYAEACNNLGNVLRAQGKLEEAVACYRQALILKPGYAKAENQLMYQLQNLCEWDQLEAHVKNQTRLLHTTPRAKIAPFTIICIPSTPEEQFVCARNWVAGTLSMFARQREKLGFYFSRTSAPRLRLGYLSADFRQHPVACLIAELLELHDRRAFEVCAYSYGPDDGSDMRRRLASACDRFVDITPASFADAASRIYEDGIDILIDLTGYTEFARTQIAALRPAPVQVSWLGYPGTMGADFIDYIVTDRFITPPGQDAYFSEKLAYLPDCYQINDRKRRIAEWSPSRKDCGLPERGFVFCCFNNTFKITAAVFDVWMRLLKKVAGSVLWLLDANKGAAANLRRAAQVRGVSPERLVFAPRAPMDQHLARMRVADLFLDTLPYNAHTTASDALWAGLPVLTCAGETFASRVAGSLLTAVGLPELITASLAEYEKLAVRLAQNPAELARLRKRLAKNRVTTPLFDSERFARHLERAYQMMWEVYIKGEQPRRIEVPDLNEGEPSHGIAP